MAEQVPDQPAGCVIEESADAEGITLSWRVPSAGAIRYCAAAFLALWLCAWAAGWIMAMRALLNGAFNFFLLFWLGGWTLLGGIALWALWVMLRPDRPESVRLGVDMLRYDPGRYWGADDSQPQKIVTRPIEIHRSDLCALWLERVGERQRLSFDHGADRIEIGASVREPEREWLFVVLERWRQS